jgi:4-aminobutyrate aminotransferase-like enzyme
MIGVEFVKERKTKEPATEEADEIVYEAKENGLICDLHMPIITPKGEMIRNIMPIKPPIVITQEEADRGFEILEGAIKKVTSG